MFYLIHQFLENSADLYPDKIAVVYMNHRYSYRDVEKKANSIANWLVYNGVRKGDRVAILLRNSIEYIYSYYGVLKAGGVVVPLKTVPDSKEIGRMLSDFSPIALITERRYSATVEEVRKGTSDPWKLLAISDGSVDLEGNIGCEFVTFADIHVSYSMDRPRVRLIDQDMSSILYTSGSTGEPKGAILTHLNVVKNTMSIVPYLRLTADDSCMVVLPFYYVYGKSLLNTHFAVSGTVIIDNRFAFPNSVLRTMIEEKATGFAGVPSTYSILLTKSVVSKMNFPDLRYITQAGGHMPAAIKERLLKVFPNSEIFIMYGATEASARLSYLEPSELPHRINSIGKPIPNVEMKTLTEGSKEAGYGEEGEIVARGSNIMMGYWNNPEETERALKNGWYCTGDLGFRDEEGFFYITGRKRDIIKTGIHKVAAKEIEEVLFTHPRIFECAVIGAPDELLGETIKAFVVADKEGNLEVKDIIQFCAKSLPYYKTPKQIIFCETLPKNEAGKVLKHKLLRFCNEH
jgi:acyl-CoA synthetase (AMP-forming)/AMP-acid ligase II